MAYGSGPQPGRTVSQNEWGQPGYQSPPRRWFTPSANTLPGPRAGVQPLPHGTLFNYAEGTLPVTPSIEPLASGVLPVEDDNMAAITSAIIGGGGIIANLWGQHKGRQSAERQFDIAESRAEDELTYNMQQNFQAWQQAAPRMEGSDQAYAGVMANVGIPGLAQYNVPAVAEGAYDPPPRTPEELRQRGGGRATGDGYMSNADYLTRQSTPVGQRVPTGRMGGLVPPLRNV